MSAVDGMRRSGDLTSVSCIRCFVHDLYSLLVACARNMCRRIQYSRNIYTNDHYHERYHVKRASLQALQQYWARFVCNITR